MSSQVADNPNSEATPKTDNRSQEFAQMNGAEMKADSTKSAESTVNALQSEPEEVVTTRPVAGHPLLKGLTISGGVLLLVLSFATMIGTLTGALNSSSNNQSEQNTKTTPEVKPDTEENEKGELKTAIAITSQKGELQAISKKDHGDVSPTPSPTTIPTTTAVTVRTQPIPRQSTTYQVPPPPAPVTRPSRSYQAAYIPRQSFSPAPISAPPAPQPKPVTVRPNVSSSQPLPLVRTTPKDPMQEWLAAANVGNYSSSDSSNGESNYEQPDLKNAQVEGGTGVRPVNASYPNQDSSQPPINYDGKRVLVGTRAAGVMETPIAWVGSSVSNQQEGQTSLIRLSQPLKAFDGEEVLPKGAYIVAVVNPTNSEIAQMTAVAALVNSGGTTQERQLPANSILVLGKNGNLLKAQSRKGGDNLGSSLMASLLSGLSKVAEIQNRANSETTISSLGTTTTTTNNGEKDLVAGFAQGSINEILDRMKNSNERQIQGLQQQQQVFVIEAGQQVQVFVNQSISI
ncbi:TrbI/VirB10 family protein (plasmid) [Anabaena sp. FACHB-709]|uniref:Uncharacterized protein n=2 Tax=Nostocaceae TaxID=1162 RepID=A0A1Z4KWA7_ANAVA|nr:MULTISPECIES: TrbI/VirB10 family protein [Nostocaceae]BAY73217.1 hypothetical protein NIES23_60450 [Trichormus variabilis NIES-23]HBW32234.1 hypothetical protein [Nostoc sp. UBA8866]MBD2175184.1 hypothetical protein [Anabaena cylindrica FACHB-318]MBD2266225.1 hypothetical protein [Anabaena sp. FACHB-709]MBD2275956.1 hypothetical protein [Nostoc sp. PCC 7120 = FACHB-418]